MWFETFGQIDPKVFYIFCAPAGIIVICAIINLLTGFYHECCSGKWRWGAAASIDFFTTIGCLFLTVSTLIRAADTDWGTRQDMEILCQIYPAILLVGLTMFVGGIFVRTWSLFIYNKYNYDKSAKGQEWKPNCWMWLLLIICCAICIVWVVKFQPELYEMNDLEPYTSGAPVYMCSSEDEDDMNNWKVGSSAWHAAILVLAMIGVLTNCVQIKAGTPGHVQAVIISVVVLNTLLSTIAGVVLHFVLDETETAMCAIEGGLLLWVALLAQILFLISKFVREKAEDDVDRYATIDEHHHSRHHDGSHKGSQATSHDFRPDSDYMDPISVTEPAKPFDY